MYLQYNLRQNPPSDRLRTLRRYRRCVQQNCRRQHRRKGHLKIRLLHLASSPLAHPLKNLRAILLLILLLFVHRLYQRLHHQPSLLFSLPVQRLLLLQLLLFLPSILQNFHHHGLPKFQLGSLPGCL